MTLQTPKRDTDSLRELVVDAWKDAPQNGWQIESSTRLRNDVWIRVANAESEIEMPTQGWKLHVSAASFSAREVLIAILPILLRENARFKVAASLDVLDEINSGETSQIGKFVTIYPNDDAQAVRLAQQLDGATHGLRGPTILSDRTLHPQSLVHYRYGSFQARHLQMPSGESVPAIVAPNGELVPDARTPFYRAPPWVADPFSESGIAAPMVEKSLRGGRYLETGQLFQSPHGAVFLAIDTQNGARCVLKMARRDAALKRDGRDARDRLRNEEKVLQFLQSGKNDVRFPIALDSFEEDGDFFLVQQDIEGTTLERRILENRARGKTESSTRIAAWGIEIAQMLNVVHGKGWVHRDIKAGNVIVAPNGNLHLIDFDIAHEMSSSKTPLGSGTRGSIRPNAGEKSCFHDDIYALGALLFFAATNVNPSDAPQPFQLLQRAPRLLNPQIDARLESVIARCLGCSERAVSLAEIENALAPMAIEYSNCANFSNASQNAEALIYQGETPNENILPNDVQQKCRIWAKRLGDTMCAMSMVPPNGDGVFWPNALDKTQPPSRDLSVGGSGTLLSLAEIAAELREPSHIRVLENGARWLANAPRAETRSAGLYIGEAGVGAALLRAGQVLQRNELIEAAITTSRWIATQPHAGSDLFNGTAGRLRFHLLLRDETKDDEHLAAAKNAEEALLHKDFLVDDETLCWPETLTGGGEKRVLGYAHGAAGIADSLLDLFEVTSDERFLWAAQKTARWLSQQAIRVLDDDSGLAWPFAQNSNIATPFWCHGACGIGRFFLHLAALDAFPDAMRTAQSAARSVALGARWAGPTQCHGLAGNIEFLLDLFRATQNGVYLDQAHSLLQLLAAFSDERNGQLVWSGHSPNQFAPLYMTGFAGIALCLLRLSDPQNIPHQLSRSNFARRT